MDGKKYLAVQNMVVMNLDKMTQKDYEEKYRKLELDNLKEIEWQFEMETRIMNWNAYRAVSFIIREKERVNEITILS